MRAAIFILCIACTLLACSSKKPKWYEAKVKIIRVDGVHLDASGAALDADVELDYVECPGTQIETIRGNAAFAACMSKYAAGAEVQAKIEYHYDRRGFWDWDIHELGGCKRPPDPNDTSSFDTVQECEPIVVNGVKEGFHCNRIPQKALLAKCPWFARH